MLEEENSSEIDDSLPRDVALPAQSDGPVEPDGDVNERLTAPLSVIQVGTSAVDSKALLAAINHWCVPQGVKFVSGRNELNSTGTKRTVHYVSVLSIFVLCAEIITTDARKRSVEMVALLVSLPLRRLWRTPKHPFNHLLLFAAESSLYLCLVQSLSPRFA